MILGIVANGVLRGEFNLVRMPTGDYWLPAADLVRLGVAEQPPARRALDGESYVSLLALGASDLTYDEAKLTLALTFPAATLAANRIDLSTRPPPVPATTAGNSLIFSYTLSVRRPGSNAPAQVTLDNDLNVRLGPLLLRQEVRLDTRAVRRGLARGVTQAIWDDRATARRFIAGDVLSSAGAFGGAITGVGLLLVKTYDLTPDVIRQPTASFQTATTLPAQVEVSVDGNPVYRGSVAPGPIAIENLMTYGGSRRVRVTVTDAAGRREVLEQPFLFSESVLARGLHEYGYFAGRRSQLDVDSRWRYLEAAWQGYHRYGVTDVLTVSAGGEGNPDFVNTGLGATVRSNLLGLLSAEVLTSRDRASGVSSPGWAARYSYFTPDTSAIFSRRRFAPGYQTFGTTTTSPFLRSEDRVVLSARVLKAALSLEFDRTVDPLETRFTRALRLSTYLGLRTSLSAGVQSTTSGGRRTVSGSVFLRTELDARRWAGATLRASDATRGFDLEAGQHNTQGEGFGYRVGVSHTRQSSQGSSLAYGNARWNLRPASLEVAASSDVGGGATYLEGTVSGALVGLGGYWGVTRRVSDGFALAQLGVPQAGVNVFLNNQLQGSTDASGQLLIPEVGAFGRQDISIDDKQLGMQYSLTQKRQTIAPPFRSGTLIQFNVRKVRAVAGMAWQVRGAQRLPITSRAWTLTSGSGKIEVETSSSGDFYLDQVAAGSYTGSLDVGGQVLTCRADVPDFPEAVHELEKGILCE